jgi:hypothetical protein
MTSTKSHARVQTKLTDAITTEQQICVAPLLFNLALEIILRKPSIDQKGTIECKSTQLLAYADGTVVTFRSLSDATEMYSKLATAAKEMSLEINENKTKFLYSESKGR